MDIKQKIIEFQKNEKFMEFIRFCIVGVIATGIDACIYYIVRLFTIYQIALVCGYTISLIANYFMTMFWTFKEKPNIKNAIGVVIAHLFNLFVVRMSLMYIFVSLIGLNDKIAYVPTLFISMVTNFIFVRFAVKKFS